MAGEDFLVVAGPLSKNHGGLHCVEAPIHTDEIVEVAIDAAMRADRLHANGEVVIIRKKCAPVAVASEGLGGIKTGAGNRRHTATSASVLRRAKTLRGILDHRQVVFCGNGIDGVIIRHLAEKTHRHERLGGGRDGCLDLVHGDIEIQRINIHKDRFRPNERNGFGGADPCERHRDHLIARTDLQRPKSDLQTVGAARHGDGVFASHISPQSRLQLRHLGTMNKLAVIQHPVDALVYR